jgi:hypothetical protein
MAKKPKKSGFDAQDLMKLLSKVSRAVTGDMTTQDAAGGLPVSSKALPFAGQATQAANVRRKMDNEILKGVADFFVPASESVRLAQGKATPDDALWAALGLGMFGKPVKRVRQAYGAAKTLRDVGGQKGPSGPLVKQYGASKDEADLLLWRLLLGE